MHVQSQLQTVSLISSTKNSKFNNLFTIIVPTEHLQFAIMGGFLTLTELKKVSTLNKYYNIMSKKQIEIIKYVIKNILKSKYLLNYNTLYSFINVNYKDDFKMNENEMVPYISEDNTYTYNKQYWYNLFGRKLTSEELAIYYCHFMKNYNCSATSSVCYETSINTNIWHCIAYKDGFIKSFASKNDNSIIISNPPDKDEIIITFKRKSNFKTLLLVDIIIEYEYSYDYKEKINLIDHSLFKKICIYTYNNGKHDNKKGMYMYPSIDNVIEKYFPVKMHS